ncbi:MAG: hypothetical protein K8U03_10555 [Planctomycetia bacterium]|nr:hypothetical protein [Planctomycetia bacterium]
MHKNYTDYQSPYKPPSPEWRNLDAQIYRQLYEDMKLIATRNDGLDLKDHIRALRLNPWQEVEEVKYDSEYSGRKPEDFAAERLAKEILPIDNAVISGVGLWMRNRSALLAIAKEVREWADKIRNRKVDRRTA